MRRSTSLGRVAFVVAIMSSSLGCELIASVDRDQIVDETNLTDGGGDAKADSADAKSDVQPDTQADTKLDTQPDTQADTKLDTQPDVQPDTKADVQPDVQPDVIDSSIDVQPDAVDSSIDVQPDVPEDVTPDTTADVNPPECVQGSDCLAAIGECELHTCVEGKCGVEAGPDTKVPAQDPQVFCKKNTCSAGSVVVVNDDTLVKDDGKECTTDTCAAGAEVHTPVAVNTACGGTGSTLKCNAAGECVGCTTPSECATPTEACLQAACTAGKCGTEPKTDGIVCDDSDLCTTTDVCKAGACVGAAVTCTETNACRVAGKCDPQTGQCAASTAVVDGSSCSDNNLCTSFDQCKNGDCKAVPTVTCTPSKECVVSACVPATGLCAETVSADTTACNDSDGCTQTDTCVSGTCTGSNLKTCGAASGPCKNIACVPSSGACVESNKTDATVCDDTLKCTTADACLAGACVGTAVVCADTDACKVNACDAVDGACKLSSNKPNTTSCTDGKDCTTGDVCTNGVCGGTDACVAPVCMKGGVCQSDNTCTGFVDDVGAACTDSNLCTTGDLCGAAGACIPGTATVCPVVECKTSGACNSLNGNCEYTDVSGTSCTGFVHKAAECVANNLRIYSNTGGCTAGTCTETYADTVCALGCSAGACNTVAPLPIGWCRTQYPDTITNFGGVSTNVFGRVFVSGLTDLTGINDLDSRVVAQFGHGSAADPSTWTDWTAATANSSYGPASANYEANNDEYQATFTTPAQPGSTLNYGYRFSGDSGTTWTYCDTGSSGSSDGFNVPGVMKIVAPFFSEYIEGSSNNKAVEIYNPGPTAFSLSGCSVLVYANGALINPGTITLTATASIAPGDVYAVCNTSYALTDAAQCDQLSGSATWNGDDAIVLRCGTEDLDIIGQVGVDPGTEWGTGLTSTLDNTLQRQCTVFSGDRLPHAFDPAAQWKGYATDSSSIGSYTCPLP